jgi:stage V sporulation protein G
MMVTAVSMRVVEREKVKAFASITLDDEFVVHDLRIIEGQKGLFVAMPSRKLPNGEFRDVAHPIKPEVREMIQTAVLEEYERRKEEGPDVPETIEDAVYVPQPEKVSQTVE